MAVDRKEHRMSEKKVVLAVALAKDLVVGDEVVSRLNTSDILDIRLAIEEYNRTGFFDSARMRVPGIRETNRQPPWGSGWKESADGKWWRAAIVVVRTEDRDDRIVEAFEKFQRGEATAIAIGGVGIALQTAREAWSRVLKRRMAAKEHQKVLAPIDDLDFV
jgi:hypothetical protein